LFGAVVISLAEAIEVCWQIWIKVITVNRFKTVKRNVYKLSFYRRNKASRFEMHKFIEI